MEQKQTAARAGQAERISRMEEILDRAAPAVEALSLALEGYQAILGPLRELEDYYSSGLWLEDYQDDCDGKLPAVRKRGVLAEDAVYELLQARDEVLEQMRGLFSAGEVF